MKFIDSLGREWFVRIDVNALRRIRDGMGVNFGNWSDIGDILKRMIFDDLFVVEVAYCILKPEIDTRKLSDAEFFVGVHSDAIERVCDAIQSGLSDFFRNPAIRAGIKAQAAAIRSLTESLLKPSGSESANSPGNSESTPAHIPSQS